MCRHDSALGSARGLPGGRFPRRLEMDIVIGGDTRRPAQRKPRIDLVMDYHQRAGIRFPRPKVHAIFHAVVESQIADPELPVRSTVERLMDEGLDRHEAIHAVGSVLAGHMHDLMRKFEAGGTKPGTAAAEDPNVASFEELKVLTAEQWLRSG